MKHLKSLKEEFSKKKIIFLDIDGVLNILNNGYDKFGQIFHKEFENNLRWIINETGSKIVISSSWRSDGLDKMKEMWKYRDLPGEVIDITPNEYHLVKIGKFKFYDDVKRGDEIQYWIDENFDEIETYCIIDDTDDMLLDQKDNFVKTLNKNHKDSVDIGYGLTKECSRKVIEILNRSI